MAAFELSVSGLKLRPFLQLLSVCVKMGNGFFLEPGPQSLTLRSVSESKNAHFVADMPAAFFETYRGCPTRSGSNGDTASSESNFQLVSRAVASSVLRFCPTLSRLVISYDGNLPAGPGGHGSGARTHPDAVVFLLFCQNGCTKTFHLHVGEQGVSEKADVAATDAQLTFRAVAEPRLWGSLISQFSSSVRTVVLQPTELRLTWMDGTLGGDTTSSDAAGSGSAFKAVVSADPRNFTSYVFPHAALDGGTPGASTDQFRQPPTQASLPSKTFDLKPLKWFLMIADSLQMNVRLSTGGPQLPVHIEAVRRGGGGQSDATGAVVVSCMSLLVAAVDGNTSSGPTGVAAHTPAARRPAPGLARDMSNIRSVSNFPQRSAVDPIFSTSATSNLREQPLDEPLRADSVIVQPTMGAPSVAPSGGFESRRNSVAFSAVAPSFSNATPSPYGKRGREDTDCERDAVNGSGARSSAASFVGGSTARKSDEMSANKEIAASFLSGGSRDAEGRPQGTAAAEQHDALMRIFPLDFDALQSDDDDEDDDYALEQFIASRCSASGVPSGAVQRNGTAEAESTITVVRETQL